MDSRRKHGERGQLLPFVALALVAMLGMTTLAVDVGYYRYQQRHEQLAADAAALAAAIQQISSSANATAAGRAAAAQNGYTDDAGVTTNVTINIPPQTGPNTATARAVEALVQQKQPLLFGGIFGTVNGLAYVWVDTRAVAAPNATAPGCLVTVSKTSGIDMNGSNSGINAPNCGILSNDTITQSGNGSVTAQYVGSVVQSSVQCTGCKSAPGTIAYVSDPCVSFVGCAYLEANPTPALTTYTQTTCASCTLPSGKYTNAVTISGTSTLSGFYEFDAGVTITGAVTGTNLTIYNKGPGVITLSGSETTTLTAPTSGNYAGLLIYQPASDTGSIVFNGRAGANTWTGLVYTPGVDMTTNGNEPTFSALVLNSLTDHGHNITLTVSGLGSASETNHFVLVE